jgi:hypothetical protein
MAETDRNDKEIRPRLVPEIQEAEVEAVPSTSHTASTSTASTTPVPEVFYEDFGDDGDGELGRVTQEMSRLELEKKGRTVSLVSAFQAKWFFANKAKNRSLVQWLIEEHHVRIDPDCPDGEMWCIVPGQHWDIDVGNSVDDNDIEHPNIIYGAPIRVQDQLRTYGKREALRVIVENRPELARKWILNFHLPPHLSYGTPYSRPFVSCTGVVFFHRFIMKSGIPAARILVGLKYDKVKKNRLTVTTLGSGNVDLGPDRGPVEAALRQLEEETIGALNRTTTESSRMPNLMRRALSDYVAHPGSKKIDKRTFCVYDPFGKRTETVDGFLAFYVNIVAVMQDFKLKDPDELPAMINAELREHDNRQIQYVFWHTMFAKDELVGRFIRNEFDDIPEVYNNNGNAVAALNWAQHTGITKSPNLIAHGLGLH